MAYDSNNIFAKILRGEIPSQKVYEDDRVFAFSDIAPAAPVHILVVPKGEYLSFDDFMATAPADDVVHYFKTVRAIALEQGVSENGYRLITNHGADASQSVPHFHVHILGGRSLGGLVPGDASQR